MRRICFVCSLFAFTTFGCANFVPRPVETTSPGAGVGYVYGSFEILRFLGENTMGVIIESLETKKQYRLGFYPGHGGIYPLALAPGKYRLAKSLVFKLGMGSHSKAFSPPAKYEPVFQTFELKAGEAVYLGHFLAESSSSSSGNTITHSVALKKITQDFESDSRRFQLLYPQFNGYKLRSFWRIIE